MFILALLESKNFQKLIISYFKLNRIQGVVVKVFEYLFKKISEREIKIIDFYRNLLRFTRPVSRKDLTIKIIFTC